MSIPPMPRAHLVPKLNQGAKPPSMTGATPSLTPPSSATSSGSVLQQLGPTATGGVNITVSLSSVPDGNVLLFFVNGVLDYNQEYTLNGQSLTTTFSNPSAVRYIDFIYSCSQ